MQALTNQERTPLSYCSQKYSPHPSHFLSKPSCIRHLLSSIWITFNFFFLIFKTSFQKRKKIWSSVWTFIECYSSPPSECEQGENIFPVMAKEQSSRNTLLFLSDCGRGVDILSLFRCLFLVFKINLKLENALLSKEYFFYCISGSNKFLELASLVWDFSSLFSPHELKHL